MLKRLIKEHKRVIFDGDNYSEEWHAEADRRGLPNLKDSVEAFQVLRARKNSDLFKKYGVLNKSEYDSRIHIAIEKYVKQLGIEAETMVSIAKSQILPAALEHQRRTAEAVAATKAAGVEAADSTQALREFVELVTQFRARTAEVERLAAHHEADPAQACRPDRPGAQAGDGPPAGDGRCAGGGGGGGSLAAAELPDAAVLEMTRRSTTAESA